MPQASADVGFGTAAATNGIIKIDGGGSSLSDIAAACNEFVLNSQLTNYAE